MVKTVAATVPGDPAKAARNIIALVTTPRLPLRFVGNDAYASFTAFYMKRFEEMVATRDLRMGTNFDSEGRGIAAGFDKRSIEVNRREIDRWNVLGAIRRLA